MFAVCWYTHTWYIITVKRYSLGKNKTLNISVKTFVVTAGIYACIEVLSFDVLLYKYIYIRDLKL